MSILFLTISNQFASSAQTSCRKTVGMTRASVDSLLKLLFVWQAFLGNFRETSSVQMGKVYLVQVWKNGFFTARFKQAGITQSLPLSFMPMSYEG